MSQRLLLVRVGKRQRRLVGAAEVGPELGGARASRRRSGRRTVRPPDPGPPPRCRRASARRRARRSPTTSSRARPTRAPPQLLPRPPCDCPRATRPQLERPPPARSAATPLWAPPEPRPRSAGATARDLRGAPARARARPARWCEASSTRAERGQRPRRPQRRLPTAPDRAPIERGTRADRGGTARARARCSTRCLPRRNRSPARVNECERTPSQAVKRAPNLFGKPRAAGELEGASELLDPLRHTAQRFREAKGGERVDGDLGVADPLSQLERGRPKAKRSPKVARLLYAIASSRPGGSSSSTATASRPARSASAVRPGHQRICERQRSESPSLRRSPSSR